MILLAFPRQSPGTLRDILSFLWMLPAVWAVEGKPACHLRSAGRGRTVASEPGPGPGPVPIQRVLILNRSEVWTEVRERCALQGFSALSWKHLRFYSLFNFL